MPGIMGNVDLFLSTPSARRATLDAVIEKAVSLIFLSTPSARRATLVQLILTKTMQNFYPRPPRGGRPISSIASALTQLFLSTPSARRATAAYSAVHQSEIISIHALREEGDKRQAKAKVARTISIHALREEGDGCLRPPAEAERNFYPRPPRGGRHKVLEIIHKYIKFLSTPSARRAT